MTERIKKIAGLLGRNQWVEFAYLFGSRAKGVAGGRSDWDIAIYFHKDPYSLPGWTVFQLEAEISSTIGAEAQITVLNHISSPVFAFQIINDGIIIFDKSPESRILYETMALKHYHDWQYFLARHMHISA